MPRRRSVLSIKFCCRRAITARGNRSFSCNSSTRSRKYSARPLVSSHCNSCCHSLSERGHRRAYCSGRGSQNISSTASRACNCLAKGLGDVRVCSVDMEASLGAPRDRQLCKRIANALEENCPDFSRLSIEDCHVTVKRLSLPCRAALLQQPQPASVPPVTIN